MLSFPSTVFRGGMEGMEGMEGKGRASRTALSRDRAGFGVVDEGSSRDVNEDTGDDSFANVNRLVFSVCALDAIDERLNTSSQNFSSSLLTCRASSFHK